jgi:hypothetical protein
MFRSARRILGGFLVGFASLYLVLFFLIASGLGALFLSRGEELTDHISRWGIVGPFITGLILLILGFILREGKKRPLLFLRPFNSIINELTMDSIAGRLGSSFTAVALDDGSIPAPKASLGDVAVGLLFYLPTGLLLLLFSAVVLPNSTDKLRNPDLSSMGASFPALFACSLGILAIGKAFRSVFPRSNRLVIDNEKKLAQAVKRIRALSTWAPRMFFPRSLILQSPAERWQESVLRVGEKCEFAVIDLSRISESMNWELSYLKNEKEGKFLVMIRESIELPEILGDVNAPIVRYKVDSVQGKKFSNILRHWLDTF